MSGALAGGLRERLAIEKRVPVPDGAGGLADSWATEATIWAAVSLVGHGPAVEGERRSARPQYRVVLRPRAGIGLDHRLRWRGRVLTLLSVARDPLTPDRIELIAEEQSE